MERSPKQFSGKWRPVWPDDERAAAAMLWWPDELLQRHVERTAELVAGGLERERAAQQAYRELKPRRGSP